MGVERRLGRAQLGAGEAPPILHRIGVALGGHRLYPEPLEEPLPEREIFEKVKARGNADGGSGSGASRTRRGQDPGSLLE